MGRLVKAGLDLFRWWLVFVLIRALVRVMPPDRDGNTILAGLLHGLRAANGRRGR
ncbi:MULTISPECIES: hypothetical protein [unclassified Novosphingobium]|uniref:hypothetical protein n=1 Tax=unclassified Novosphingobium TaxID=2644732 RepID=UPI000D3F6C29|nr:MULTISPECIES: hypothetical protein [unclassified Novosphingobium]PTR06424.1 hypothetical protein C8K11_12037 [Novosphingobium sp. GV055]PUA94843.1 hypothetical protein C8K12_12037 [Novosphingobium sp. GV061]PUB13768.1 hypothetical protein C8K14_12037 [Novosphingobium sp. GV079]PUB38466.1 hypothetical protein C8K10_12037 [Novosphingobium sp. GV027]